MNYKIFKFSFKTGVHFGQGSLADGEFTLGADTIFSALCHEAMNWNGPQEVEKLVDLIRKNRVRFSDGLPFIGDELYLPKPMAAIADGQTGDSTIKKAFKKLKYIPVLELRTYLAGEMEPSLIARRMELIGESDVKTLVSGRGLEEPYKVGYFRFKSDSGLYMIMGYTEQTELDYVERLLFSLSYSGIGGKISSGFGKYDMQSEAVSEELMLLLKGAAHGPYMLLSGAMATNEELEGIVPESRYLLIKRSGFISSKTYSTTEEKKRDFYLFKAGSCFVKQFEGDLFDVGNNGQHPVFRYAKPMFLEVI